MSSKRACATCCANFGFVFGAFALGGSAWLGACSSEGHPQLPAVSAGTAGRSNQPSAAGTSTEGGADPRTAGGAGGSPTEAQAGAPSSAGAGGADEPAGPTGAGGEPGLPLEPCPSDEVSAPASFPGVCSVAMGWGAGTNVAVTSGASPTFIAVTPSELTLLWSEPESSLPAYFLADREAADGAFGDPQELPFTNLVGVSPDGLRVTVQGSDGTLAEATRAARGDSFGELQPGAYADLDSDAAAHHFVLGDVTISADDRSLYYTARALDTATLYPLRVSRRTGSEPWPVGTVLQACELKAYAEFGPHPTGVSSDGLTLFYFDTARRKPRAAFRASVDADFSWFEDLSGYAGGQPNAACDRLYFSPSTGKPGLLSAARK